DVRIADDVLLLAQGEVEAAPIGDFLIEADAFGDRFGRREIGRREAVAGAEFNAVTALGGGDEERWIRPLIRLWYDADSGDAPLFIDFAMRAGGLGGMRGGIVLDAAGRERRLVG